jgi:GT2 family glycosyltransferase
MKTVSILTAWYEHPELIADYEKTVQDADEVIIVDNASSLPVAAQLQAMCERLGAKYVRAESNLGYAKAINLVLPDAIGDIIVCLNNDVRGASDFVERVRQDVEPNTFCGVHLTYHFVDGAAIPYIDGWCTAAYREVWERVGGYDTETFIFAYYEDADLSFRAVLAGAKLREINDWPIEHINGGNTTSRGMSAIAYANSEANRAKFFARVREAMRQEVTA